MRTGLKNLIKSICFIIVLGIVVLAVQEVVVPYRDWPTKGRRTTKMVRSVFNEPKNTLDVLWVGSSHVFSAITPMELYRQTNLYSYVLASVGQRPIVGYYLAKAAMGEQKPKVVVLDVGGCFHSESENRNPSAWQSILDAFPFNRIADRVSMAQGLAEMRGERFNEAYFFRSVLPILQYHTNYVLTDEEYLNLHTDQLYHRKGFACTTNVKAPKTHPVDRTAEPDLESDYFNELLENFNVNTPTVRKFKELCDESGAELVLMKTPVCTSKKYDGHWSVEKHWLVQTLADELGVTFMDLNYQEVGVDWKTDTRDKGMHMNLAGANKVTSFLGRWLLDNYDFGAHDDAALNAKWDAQLDLYDEEMIYYYLRMRNDVISYLDYVDEHGYTLLAAVSGGVSDFWNDDLQAKLAAVTGTKLDLRDASDAAAAIASAGGEVLAQKGREDKSSLTVTLSNGAECRLKSAASAGEGEGKIEVDGEDYACTGRGIRFVVYDEKLGSVVDSVTFGMVEGELQAIRDNESYEVPFNLRLIETAAEAMKGV